MFAVIRTGGKQYRIAEGQTLDVESLTAEPGQAVELTEVLMVGEGDAVAIGTPLVAGARVTATVVAHGRAPKVRIVKFKRRKHHRKQMGHRQNFTRLTITQISRG